MAHFTVFALVTLYISSGLAAVNVTDYIHWKIADIEFWHNAFPMRALVEESATIEASKMAISSMSYNLNASLLGIVAFQLQEFQTAQLLMNGTNAQGCLEGIAHYILTAIEDALNTYIDCTSEAMSKFSRLEKSRSSIESTYWTAYLRALNGIDVCQKTYKNKDSYQRLMSCVDSMTADYYKVANSTQYAVIPSPTMSYFKTTVVGCASDAANSVTDKGYKFLELLIDCAALVDGIDLNSYKQELNKWKGYNDTLGEQIVSCQNKNYYQVHNFEIIMTQYNQMQKEALEIYVVESRGLDYYLTKVYSALQQYYNTVTLTALDNPGDDYCTSVAREELDSLASTSASSNQACDMKVVNRTIALINEINNSFCSLNIALPSFGNPSIINCFSQGYQFAPKTVEECFDILSTGFNLNYLDQKVIIDQDIAILHEFENTFYNGDDLPCGGTTSKRLLLGGDVALYNLQRCLYYTSGTTYPVTTPVPYTTPGSTSTYYYSTTPSPITTSSKTTTSTAPSTTTASTTPLATRPSTTSSTTFTSTTPSTITTKATPSTTQLTTIPSTTTQSTTPPTTTTTATPSTTQPTTTPSTPTTTATPSTTQPTTTPSTTTQSTTPPTTTTTATSSKTQPTTTPSTTTLSATT